MPPHIHSKNDDGFLMPFQYLHPGIRKPSSPEQIYQPVFQQSVTLTASMWDENEGKGKMDWSFENWGILSKYSPLLIGLVCGFGVVLLIMSTVMLWRYCVISASNKLCCKGTYGEMTTQQQKSLPVRKECNQSGFENFQSKPPLQTSPCHLSLQRSTTLSSMPTLTFDSSHYAEPMISADHYTSHSYLQMPSTTEESKNICRSSPDLDELYAKVNFSKKRKNRMRRDDAAVIAISKSHSSQNNNSSESFGSAVVVYNERTAL